jgi:hypothetical protein
LLFFTIRFLNSSAKINGFFFKIELKTRGALKEISPNVFCLGVSTDILLFNFY